MKAAHRGRRDGTTLRGQPRIRGFLISALLTVCASLAVGAAPSAAAQTTLNFDEITSDQYIASDHYASSGVLIVPDGVTATNLAYVQAYGPPSVLDDPNGGPFSVPSYVCGNVPADTGIVVTFVDPTTLLPATTDFVQANVTSGPGPDLLSSNVALIAYDADGDVIATDHGDTTKQFDTLSVSVAGIASVRLPAGAQLDCFDDLTFNSGPRPTVTALSPTHAWIGLKNSDDQGTQFDLMAELLKNDTPLATGLKRCITGVTRNTNLATEAVVPWDAFASVPTSSGDVLSLRLSTRIGTNPNNTKCSGPGGSHSNAVGLRLYYDSADRPSRFDVTIAPDPSQDLYLHSDGNPCTSNASTGVTTRTLDFTAPTGTTPKCVDSPALKFAGGNAWRAIGTWNLAPMP